MIVLCKGRAGWNQAAQAGRENLTLIAGGVDAAIQPVIDGMANLFKQHRLDLAGAGRLQPGGVQVDAPTALRCIAGVGAMDATEGGGIEDLELDPQAFAPDAGLQRAGGVRILNPKHLAQQGAVGAGVAAAGPGP